MGKTSKQLNVFDAMGNYWAEMADQNATDRQVKFIKNNLKSEGLILDLACGTGRHIVPLSKEGYNIVGLDVSASLLKIAKNRERNNKLVRADMRFLPFKPDTFSAALSMDTSFGYLFSERDDLQTLNELNYTVTEGGMLIIDVFNREKFVQKYETTIKKDLKWSFLLILAKSNNRLASWLLLHLFNWREYPSFLLIQKRTISKNGDNLHDSWAVYDKGKKQIKLFEHVAQLYQLMQLKELLHRADFLINQIYGDYEKQRFGPVSNRLILVAVSSK